METNYEVLSEQAAAEPILVGPFDGLDQEAQVFRIEELTPFLERVESEMVEKGHCKRTRRELRLVFEEAIVNGLKHGNGGDPSKRVRVRYYVGTEALLADIDDEGPGFDCSAVPDPTEPENWDCPTGRGLLLMRHFTSWLRYHGCGNRLTLCKHRSAG
jgi:serine/threonine-protein kinase RsbW